MRNLAQASSAARSDDIKGFVNAFSVDVEDYFHTEAMSSAVSREQWEKMPQRVDRNTRRLFEILANHNVHCTFFFLGWVAEKIPGLVREAVQLGHEIGCHSYWHRRIYTLSPDEFRADTMKAKQAIEQAGGVSVRGYRAPSFSLVPGTEWAIDILVELGFAYDSSVHPIWHDLYSNASAPRHPHRIADGALLELPIATIRLGNNVLPIGGGGYMRILPYAYTRWGLARFRRNEARAAVIYLHPWEIDPGQPRIGVSTKSRFRQYTGLSSMEHKLERLLQDFPFAPIATVFDNELLKNSDNAANCPRVIESSNSFSTLQPEPPLNSADPAGGTKWSG
jgi:polysaccharide deacetylase family protein (PEP-CTERM system associated)